MNKHEEYLIGFKLKNKKTGEVITFPNQIGFWKHENPDWGVIQ